VRVHPRKYAATLARVNPALVALADRQHDVFTRAQADASGYSSRLIRTLTKPGGPWVIVRRGVYILRENWDRLDWRVGQWRVRDWAAHLSMTTPHLMSHDSAARAWGLETLRLPDPMVHVTRPGVGGSRSEAGVNHHLRRIGPSEIYTVSGLPVTDRATAAIDIACFHGLWAGVVACDSALRHGVSRDQMRSVLTRMRRWPGVGDARLAAEFADAGAESVGESMARLLVWELGIGEPETQFAVRIGDSTVWCDLRVGCHVFEFDGRVKYTPRAEGGLADRAAGEVVWDEKVRQHLVCAEGLGMSRIVWSDLFGSARTAAKRRLRAEWEVTVRRFGTELPPHLAAYRQRRRTDSGRSAVAFNAPRRPATGAGVWSPSEG
jgi:hypothetical protein